MTAIRIIRRSRFDSWCLGVGKKGGGGGGEGKGGGCTSCFPAFFLLSLRMKDIPPIAHIEFCSTGKYVSKLLALLSQPLLPRPNTC